jgi:hypothetical protein
VSVIDPGYRHGVPRSRRTKTLPARLALAVGLTLIIAAGCSSDNDSPSATTTGADTTDTASGDTSAPDTGTVISVGYSGGAVSGDTGRNEVAIGDEVTIEITSDAADEVHIHGYDELIDVAAGETAVLTFTADIPGVFEVELESSGLLLFQLEVS